MTPTDVLREALDQYVTNQGEYVETGENITAADRTKLEIAEALLDDLNAPLIALAEETP